MNKKSYEEKLAMLSDTEKYPTWSEVFANAIVNLQKEINSMYREILDLRRRIDVLENFSKKEADKHEH